MAPVSGSTNGPGAEASPPLDPSPVSDGALAHAEPPASVDDDGPRDLVRPNDACERLHDRMLGELLLRHVTGADVLDVGHGVPTATQWVAARAARLEVLPRRALPTEPDAPLPWPDATFSVVYCVRTLPHLGHDAETSERAATRMIEEIGRVLRPGGVALVEIDNPLSLWGAVHGLRRPAKALEPGPMCLVTPEGITRFETLRQFARRLPPTVVMTQLHGLRIVAPVPNLLAIPLLGRILSRLEWWLRDMPIVSRMGGHLLAVLHRQDPPRP